MAVKPVDEKSEDARRDDGLRRLLKMKPKRHQDMKLGKPRNRKKVERAKDAVR
jgi:hypothetical protein